MYVNIRRRQAFFGSMVGRICAYLTRYDFDTGTLVPIPGGMPDDVVEDVSEDGSRIILRSTTWMKSKHRNRITFLQNGVTTRQTERFLSWWCRFDSSSNSALISTYNIKKRPVVFDIRSGEFGEPIARDVDARYGDIDPMDGSLWAPDQSAKNSILSVHCSTGEITRTRVRLGAKAQNVRFSPDGNLLFITAKGGPIICCDREGSTVWSQPLADFGGVGATHLLLTESGNHLCLPILQTPRSEWGEKVIIEAKTGRIERSRVGHKGPPAQLARDWMGDCCLTYTGEIVDMFTGEILNQLSFPKISTSDVSHSLIFH